MDRRGFLRGMMTASAAAIAAHFGVDEAFADDVKEELAKDLLKDPISVGFSDIAVFDNRPVWASVSKMASYWADEAAKQLNREMDKNIMGAAKTMALMMDDRLYKAGVTEDRKIIAEVPKFTNIRRDYRTGKMELDMLCGVQEVDGLFGEKQVKVGYIVPQDIKILDHKGAVFA